MKLKQLTTTEIKALEKQTLTFLKAIIEKTPEHLENESKTFLDASGYVIDVARTGKSNDKIVEDIQARIKTINSAIAQRIAQQDSGKEFDDVEEMTIDGLAELLAEHIILVNIERPIVGREIDAARAQGDLSENAEYDSAREKQGQLEQKIAEVKDTMDRSQIIDAKQVNTNVVSVGTKVTFKKGTKDVTYTIKGSTQADPLNGVISRESAVAKAILGKEVGDKVSIRTKTPYSIKITKIEKGL